MKISAILQKKRSDTLSNFFWRGAQLIGKQGVTFLIFISCARLLGVYEFGVYNYVLTIVLLLTIFGDCGISVATSKYVAEYNATNKDRLKLVLFNTGLIILILTVCVSAIIIIFGKHFLGNNYKYILYLVPLIFIVPMTSLYDGIYVGLKKFKLLALISLCVGAVSLGFIYVLIKQYGLIGALIAQSLFYTILLLTLALCYRGFSFKLDRNIIKEIGGYSILIGLANLGFFLYFRFDVLIFGIFNYIDEIAYYELANKIWLFLVIPWGILSQVLAPDITRAFSQKNVSYITAELKKYTKLSIIYGCALSVALFFAIKPIMSACLPAYNKGIFYLFFNLLIIVFPIRAFGTVIVNTFIIPTGNAKIVANINLLFGLSKIAINFALIILMGVVGVLISTIILDYLSVVIARRVLLRNIMREEPERYGKPA